MTFRFSFLLAALALLVAPLAASAQTGRDLVLVSSTYNVCVNDGSGTFDCSDVSSNNTSSVGVAVADFDGVNGDDFAVAKSNDNFNEVCLNDGAGGFVCSDVPGTQGNTGASPVAVDLDGVNGPDIVFTSSTGSGFPLACLNDGSGSFACSDIPGGQFSNDVAAADFDDTMGVDLVFTTFGAYTVCLNDGDASFTCAFTRENGLLKVATGDLDGINGPDFALAKRRANGAPLNLACLNDGSASFTCSAVSEDASESEEVEIADFDGLNGLDLFFTNGSGADRVCLSDGMAGYSCSDLSAAPFFARTAVTLDVDGQNRADIVVSTRTCLNDGTGSFTCSTGLPSFSGAAAGDFGSASDGGTSVVPLGVFFNEASNGGGTSPRRARRAATEAFLEVAVGPNFTSELTDVSVVIYAAATGTVQGSVALDMFTRGATVDDLTLFTLSGDALSGLLANDGDALAICFDDGTTSGVVTNGGTVQFLSTNGTTTAVDGCASGLTSTDLGVSEDGTDPADGSIGLTNGPGTPDTGGDNFGDFVAAEFAESTPGVANTGQSFAGDDVVQPLACSMDTFLALGDFDIDGNDATFGEFAEIENGESDPVDLTACSFATFDPLTERVLYTAQATGTVMGMSSYYFASQSGDQMIPFGSIADGPVGDARPGAIVLLEGTTMVGASVQDVLPNVVAGLVYRDEDDVFAQVSGGATAQERATFAAAFGNAVAGESDAADAFALSVAPNPVAGRGTVAFELATAADVSVTLVDALGRQVATLAEGAYPAGRHSLELATAALPTGVYVVRALLGDEARTARVTVVR